MKTKTNSKRIEIKKIKNNIKSLKKFQSSLVRQIRNKFSAYGGTQKNRIKTLKDVNMLLAKAKQDLAKAEQK